MLARIFGPKKEEVAGIIREMHNKMLHSLYTSPNTTRVIKPQSM